MIGKPIRFLFVLFTLSAGILSSACGTVATPEWAADAQATTVALAETSVYQTSIAPTATFTQTPVPTETPVPPTATATNTAEPTATSVPPTETAAPTTAAETQEAAAGSGDDAAFAAAVAAADPSAGEAAFQLARNMPDGAIWSCAQCHSVTPDQLRLIGPGLWGVAQRGEEKPEYGDAIVYIHHSIINPNEYIAPPDASGAPYPPNLMPPHYGNPEVLPPGELEAIVAYLLTLQ